MRIIKFPTVLLILLLTAVGGVTQAEAERQGGDRYENMPSGTLVLPRVRDNLGREAGSKRKCMKVCKQWGESCITDPRTGERKCRRSCKQFGMECFN